MKKLALTFAALFAWSALAYAGPERFSGKEMKEVIPPPCPEWYADNEWNVNVFGTYVFTDNNWTDDTYLEADHAYGGGIDVKYFFHRYFGVGIEAWGVSANRRSRELVEDENSLFEPEPLFESGSGPHDSRIVGGVLATITFRYPIHCSRFSPYVFSGGGVVFGGGESARFIDDDFGIDNDRTVVSDSDTKGIIQLGGGLEVRITRHIGITNDFSWNVIDGQRNNFGMSRTGLNFAF